MWCIVAATVEIYTHTPWMSRTCGDLNVVAVGLGWPVLASAVVAPVAVLGVLPGLGGRPEHGRLGSRRGGR